MKIDLHVHSKYSKRPSQWILKKLGCPESFTEPLQIYRAAKNRGMTHVTITDHNSILGALEIAHLPDTFVSEEITTYFPDNGCKIHVLALGITESQHEEIQKERPIIYNLAAYLRREKIFNIVAHPLYAINDRLTVAHFEQLVLLFKNFELNGARNQRENQLLRDVLGGLTSEEIERLSDKHDMAPLYAKPWQKRLYGGSDDHSSLNIARTHTRFSGDADDDPVQTLRSARPEVIADPATPLTMSHNLYAIAYQFYRGKFKLDRYAEKDILMRFLDRNLRADVNRTPGILSKLFLLWQYRRREKQTVKAPVSDSLMTLLRRETRKLIQEDPSFYDDHDWHLDFKEQEQKWFAFVNRVSKRVMLHFGNHLLDHLSGANLFNIFATIGSAGGLYTLLAPYFVSYSQFSKDRLFSETVRRQFGSISHGEADGSHSAGLRMAHFTDTYYEVNGVALTLQQHVRFAVKNNKYFKLVTCHNDHQEGAAGVRNFKPIGQYELPEYPEQKIFYPPFLEMLSYCYEKNFNHIHTATPGPIGLAALAIAKILKLPISGTYHTAIPQYARILTGDDTIQDLAWKYVLWYYDQLDVIYAPSQSTCDELVEKGISADKIRVYPRGIDLERFTPAKRNGVFGKLCAITSGTTFIYVGRVSKEKNLHLLADAFRMLADEEAGRVNLVVVGDGPYCDEMQSDMNGLPCFFTGYLTGELLSQVYASADLFVFPSATDTFGNVVLEAQASGLPVIVTDQGGPCENVVDGETGLVVDADSTLALLEAMRTLLRRPDKRAAMGRAARIRMETRSFEAAFLSTWQMVGDQQPELLAKAG